MSGLKSRAHLIRKYTYPTSLISSSLTQLGALYVQKGFSQPDVIKHSTSASKYCCCPFCPDLFMDVHFCHCIFVITFLACMLAHFCNAFLIRFSDFRHGIILKFAGTVFSRSPLLKTTDDIFSRHTAFVCGGNPCSEGLWSHVQFLIFSYSSQFTSRGTRHPWPTVCNEATVLDGISGLITLTYLQLVTMFFHYPSFLMTFRLFFYHMHE